MSESRIKIKDVNYSLLESYRQGLEKNHNEAVISRSQRGEIHNFGSTKSLALSGASILPGVVTVLIGVIPTISKSDVAQVITNSAPGLLLIAGGLFTRYSYSLFRIEQRKRCRERFDHKTMDGQWRNLYEKEYQFIGKLLNGTNNTSFDFAKSFLEKVNLAGNAPDYNNELLVGLAEFTAMHNSIRTKKSDDYVKYDQALNYLLDTLEFGIENEDKTSDDFAKNPYVDLTIKTLKAYKVDKDPEDKELTGILPDVKRLRVVKKNEHKQG